MKNIDYNLGYLLSLNDFPILDSNYITRTGLKRYNYKVVVAGDYINIFSYKNFMFKKRSKDDKYEKFGPSITMHPKTSKFTSTVTYNYDVCYDCNNYLGDLLTVYFNNMWNFRKLSTLFIDIYTKYCLIFNSDSMIHFRLNVRRFKSKFYKGK